MGCKHKTPTCPFAHTSQVLLRPSSRRIDPASVYRELWTANRKPRSLLELCCLLRHRRTWRLSSSSDHWPFWLWLFVRPANCSWIGFDRGSLGCQTENLGHRHLDQRLHCWDCSGAYCWGVHIHFRARLVSQRSRPNSTDTANNVRAWVFYIGAIALAVISVGFWFTRESRPSVILNHRLNLVRKTTGFDGLTCDESSKIPDIRTFVTTMVSRPIRFFFTEPIVCTVSIMSATIFGSVYLQTEGIKVIYRSFGFDERQSALPLISWNVGLILTVPLRMYDWKFVSYRLRMGHDVRPEDKMTGFYVAAPVLAVSLWWLSWTIPPHVRYCAERRNLCAINLVDKYSGTWDFTSGIYRCSYAHRWLHK